MITRLTYDCAHLRWTTEILTFEYDICAYGSVSAGRGKSLIYVLFLFKVEPCCGWRMDVLWVQFIFFVSLSFPPFFFLSFCLFVFLYFCLFVFLYLPFYFLFVFFRNSPKSLKSGRFFVQLCRKHTYFWVLIFQKHQQKE